MPTVSKICQEHLSRRAYIYVRQSSLGQVLNHPESARRQRDLVKLAAGLGWSPSQIIVVDEDQGKSATTSNGREAFKRIVGDVSVGEAGIVIGLEIARLARNCADFFPLIEMCALTRTLIADEEGVYNPNDPNDRLVLGVKGTLSEAESHMIRARLHGARWSLARRGELRPAFLQRPRDLVDPRPHAVDPAEVGQDIRPPGEIRGDWQAGEEPQVVDHEQVRRVGHRHRQVTVVAPYRQQHVPARKLFRHELRDVRVDRLTAEIDNRYVEVRAQRRVQVIFVEDAQLDEDAPEGP